MSRRRLRVVACVCALCLITAAPAEAQLGFTAGEELSYRFVREHSGAVKVLGESASTDEIWSMDLKVQAGAADTEGRIPLEVTTGSLTANVPVLVGLSMKQSAFDSSRWDGKSPAPAHSILQYLALRKHPLTLTYAADGSLAGVQGLGPLGAEVDAGMARDFSRAHDFAASRALYRTIYTEGVQKALWNQILVFDLPEEFEVGVPWTTQRLMYIQPYYVWVRGTYTAEDAPDGGYRIEASFEVPASKQASAKFDAQQYLYTVKNGTGTGKYVIEADGRVRNMELALHTYLDVVLIASGQRIPMDQYYSRLKLKLDRQ